MFASLLLSYKLDAVSSVQACSCALAHTYAYMALLFLSTLAVELLSSIHENIGNPLSWGNLRL